MKLESEKMVGIQESRKGLLKKNR